MAVMSVQSDRENKQKLDDTSTSEEEEEVGSVEDSGKLI